MARSIRTSQRRDPLSPTQRSELMSRVRSRDTKPELVVRRLVWALGFRYRLHGLGLPGRPDLVFKGRRKVIFVHGCFWHQHPDPACKRSRRPASRRDYWNAKLSANRERDIRNERELRRLGWRVLVIWECELRSADLQARLRRFLSA